MVLLPRDSQCHEEVSTTTFTCHCTSDRTDGSRPSQYVAAASGGGGGGGGGGGITTAITTTASDFYITGQFFCRQLQIRSDPLQNFQRRTWKLLSFLQARCPSCHLTNSVKALKE